eukprot:COSAG01_NODE_74625_length_206_cov_74.523364_1_plen_68_part_11
MKLPEHWGSFGDAISRGEVMMPVSLPWILTDSSRRGRGSIISIPIGLGRHAQQILNSAASSPLFAASV